MAITGKAKKKLVKNVVDSLWRKRLKRHTINLIPLHEPEQSEQTAEGTIPSTRIWLVHS
jgi:hypothetical protein